MDKLKKCIKTFEDWDMFESALVLRMKSNIPISSNSMIDGYIIGLMLNCKFSREILIPATTESCILDGTIQKLEQITLWFIKNEIDLCEIFVNYKLDAEDNKLKGLFTSKKS